MLSQFRHLLAKPAQKTGFLEGPITVVIDGLDECNSVADQVTLLGLILEASKTRNMRFLIASRPEQHIDAFFNQQGVSQRTCKVQLDEESFKTSEDIKVFLRAEFARIRQARPEACPRLPNGEEWPGERVINQLALESDSQFMFPTLAIAFIDTPYFSPNKQLRSLLAARPSRAFSALDALYHKILSRRPPSELLQGENDLREYQEVVMGVLRVIIAWSGAPLSAAKIAAALDKPVDVVQNVVRGPMRSLFKFHTSDPDSPITLCHKSLRDYLLDRNRSEEYFIPSAEEDDLFVAILSRLPPSHSLHPSSRSRDIVMDVLATVLAASYQERKESWWSVPQIAAFLDVDSTVVEHVVNIGATKLLFNFDPNGVSLSTESVSAFLQDPDRAGIFFIAKRRMDTLFINTINRRPPPNPSFSYSRDVLLDILALMDLNHKPMLVCQVAALIEVDSSLVRHVVTFGSTGSLFRVDNCDFVRISTGWLSRLLWIADRSSGLFFSERRMDAPFIRILSVQPPSGPSRSSQSHSILIGVLTAIVVFGGALTIQQIASVLDGDPDLVEHVINVGPTKPLFVVAKDGARFSGLQVERFLLDTDSSGPFFISRKSMDILSFQALSRHPPPNTSSLYSKDVFLDILATVLRWLHRVPIPRIAALLKVDSGVVEHVVKLGPTKCFFSVREPDGVCLRTWRLGYFLQDPDRSGDFFTSEKRLDPCFTQLLSQQLSSGPSRSSSQPRCTLTSVLTAIVGAGGTLKAHEIASLFNVDPIFVEHVVKVGPTSPLFVAAEDGVKFSMDSIEPFLLDSARSGEFCITESSIDAFFIHVLSRGMVTPSPDSQSQNLLMDVLTSTLLSKRHAPYLTISQLASFLGIDRGLVEDVIYGPAKALFRVQYSSAWFSTELLMPFLEDASRSGEFCITERRMDALSIRAISHQPSSDSLSYPSDILMDILPVMASFPAGLSIPRIASALEADPEVIKHTILGPSKTHSGAKYIEFLSKCLQPALVDAERSGELFISQERIDALFNRILSQQPLSDPQHAYSRDIFMGVLTAITNSDRIQEGLTGWTGPLLAAFLDVDPTVVEAVVNIGPSRLLFCERYNEIIFSNPLLESFLKDASRSGQFFICDTSIDTFFTRILSTPPLPGARTYSRDVLKDVLTLVVSKGSGGLTDLAVAVALDVDLSLVEGVFGTRSTRSLFTTGRWDYDIHGFSTPSLGLFLQDVERSGEFYISNATIDTLFIRVLSLPPPPHVSYSHSKGVLIGVMMAILASPEPLTTLKIASLLGVDRSLVEGVVDVIPAKVFFDIDEGTLKVTISAPLLKPFLHDAARSGEFFIPTTITLDTIPKPWLQLPSDAM